MSSAHGAGAAPVRPDGAAAPQPTSPDRTLAPFGRRLTRVTRNQRLGAYRLLWVSDPDGPAPRPGQFAMIAAAERWGGGADERPHLPRAFSIALISPAGEAAFLLEDVGPGTRRLCELEPEDGLWVLGPLGRGFSDPPPKHRCILVGGGIGIAALTMLGESRAAARPQGGDVRSESALRNSDLGTASRPRAGEQDLPRRTVLTGFRSAPHAEAARLLGDPLIATDDGTVGHAGPVTDLLEAELQRERCAVVRACGPPAMLEAVRAACEREQVPAELALEATMACGFGSCFGCVVARRGGGYLRVCVDGPVIDAAEIAHVPGASGR